MTMIAIHLLQNFAPSNLNRDGFGNPKQARFGGVERARWSSQSQKRTIRTSPDEFRQALEGRADIALATRADLAALIGQQLDEQHKDNLSDSQRKLILDQSRKLGKSSKNDKSAADETTPVADSAAAEADGEEATASGKQIRAQLAFLSPREVAIVTDELVSLAKGESKLQKKDKKKGLIDVSFASAKADTLEPHLERILREKLTERGSTFHAVDVALFGRMITSSVFDDVDGATQVAHAISTHEMEVEFDYFTAVSDVDSTPGADHLGDTAYNSAMYYRYMNLHWEQLLGNLLKRDVRGNDWKKWLNYDAKTQERRAIAVANAVAQAFVRSAIEALPKAKSTGFDNNSRPEFVLVEVLPHNRPISYANAFQTAVEPAERGGWLDPSVQKLVTYIPRICRMHQIETRRAYISINGELAQPGLRQSYHNAQAEKDTATYKEYLGDLLTWVGAELGVPQHEAQA